MQINANDQLFMKILFNVVALLNKRLKILIIRDIGLGDVLMTLPLLKAIKNNLFCNLTFSTKAEYIPLVQTASIVDNIIEYEKDKTYPEYDIVINLVGKVDKLPINSEGHRMDLLAGLMGIPINLVPRTWRLNIPKEYIDRGKELLLNKGIKSNSIMVAIQVDGFTEIRKLFYINEIAQKLIDIGCSVVFLGQSNNSYNSPERVINLVGLPLMESVGVLKNCNAIISPDSGLSHLAGFMDVPLIVVYGTIKPEFRVGYYSNYIALHNKSLPCYPCWDWGLCECKSRNEGEDYMRCMRSVTSDIVVNAVMEIINSPVPLNIIRSVQ